MLTTTEICHVDTCKHGCSQETGCKRAGARMLTVEEMKAATMPWRDLGWALRAIQRKFAEVNGIRIQEPKP